MRPPVADIAAPPFPARLPWVNVATLRMDKQLGRPVLVEFWDFCRVNSLRTLPYLQAWHARYAEAGLRVVSVHCPGFDASRDPEAVRAAVARLGIEHPVLIDTELELWRLYGNEGWPARYLFDQRGMLFDVHMGEGAYAETELAIGELLGLDVEPVGPLHPEDDPQALVVAPTADVAGPYSGPYEAGAVWAVLDGRGTVAVNGRPLAVEHPGAYPLIEHEHHTAGVLDLEVGDGVSCEAVCFTPGPAPG
ncbi:thioredoxin domain-containing protein [Capillimicrobium parvum]|uniref:Thiol-disulfide oxidoreductase ResA n=1 Tax=Capillimicrobium parvum TaxID=2884022 RepID=A0A9E6Y0W5_9ACTN|nr:redoxin domain-containing protein [Capillimicrobium parvum]UGS37728.1 Thiol-disulfide oxidoreductase ResA [Capillimicrobium parvum]